MDCFVDVLASEVQTVAPASFLSEALRSFPGSSSVLGLCTKQQVAMLGNDVTLHQRLFFSHTHWKGDVPRVCLGLELSAQALLQILCLYCSKSSSLSAHCTS